MKFIRAFPTRPTKEQATQVFWPAQPKKKTKGTQCSQPSPGSNRSIIIFHLSRYNAFNLKTDFPFN